MTTREAVANTLGRLRQRLRGRGGKPGKERRLSKRAKLRIPIQVRIGEAPPTALRLHDISPSGLSLEGRLAVAAGASIWVRFEGYPGVCESFVLAASVVRAADEKLHRLAAKIDREKTRPQALQEYRKLVIHYLRHKPLLESKDGAMVDGRCRTCGWVGRVSLRNPTCSRCGLRVQVLIR